MRRGIRVKAMKKCYYLQSWQWDWFCQTGLETRTCVDSGAGGQSQGKQNSGMEECESKSQISPSADQCFLHATWQLAQSVCINKDTRILWLGWEGTGPFKQFTILSGVASGRPKAHAGTTGLPVHVWGSRWAPDLQACTAHMKGSLRRGWINSTTESTKHS